MTDDVHDEEAPAPEKLRLPKRLALLPIVALGVARSVASEIALRGIHTVGDIASSGTERLEPGRGLSQDSVDVVRSRFDALARGEFDPTLSIAGTLPDELDELLVRAGITRIERTLPLLRQARGLAGDRIPLGDLAKKLDITRERVRQIRNHAELRISGILDWFEPRSVRVAREAVARAGGTAPLTHVAWSVGLMMPPVDIDADAYLRWILSLAADPGARLSDDRQTVSGPDPEVMGLRRFGEGPPPQAAWGRRGEED
jgi:hypothetical protein